MFFTVIDARDGRLVAESEDRAVKLTLEGPHSAQVGQLIHLEWCFRVDFVAVAETPAVTHDLSDEAAEDAADLALIAETLAESDERIPFAQVKAELGLAEAPEEV